jgi:hypothetical protein
MWHFLYRANRSAPGAHVEACSGSGEANFAQWKVDVGWQEDRSARGAPYPLHVTLSNGDVHDVDCLVCGIGVEPNTDWLPAQLERSPVDGGILVDLYVLCPEIHVKEKKRKGKLKGFRVEH